MTEPSHPLGFWVALVGRMLDERLETALEEHGVTHAQWQVLALLRRGPADAQQVQDAADDSDDLGELIESGWILHGEIVTLTDRGRTATDALAEVLESIGSLLERVVAPEDADAVARTLEAAARELGWAEQPPA
ncbi:MarR family transcriptional regulator [Homoserinibacter sp. YIM 151385]|uniref:MarR family transcriptional regulator n=1 Tax=Homoserinibacter sp. YIM 151385 TaxID=2985506 RepID=UPI0022F09E12|nr:MarR family transcriptional regulator [Homoserinibacter sp. YIM 151385]WBU37306.1 MarR family transcriptional regulator [Homoserinibacter sp. YIM 151385]